MKIDKTLIFKKDDALDPKKFNEILAWLNPIRKKEQEEADLIYIKIIKELNEVGVTVTSIDNVLSPIRTYSEYLKMLPILLRWFKKEDNSDVKGVLARILTIKWANPDALQPLIEEFEKIPNNWIWHESKWAIGNALAVIADDSILEDLVKIVTTKEHGSAREMVVVALGNMKKEENKKSAIDILIKLLDDEEVVGHALIALRKLKAVETEKYIKKFTDYPQTWIRNEAKRTLKSFKKVHYSKN